MKFAGLSIKTFKKGGVHPHENKHITVDKAIENFHIPQKAVIPLVQHLGKPAKPVVNRGDIVTEGQLIAEKDGMISANIHSSIPGKVLNVGTFPSLNNLKIPAIVIQFEGEFNKGKKKEADWSKLSNEKLIEAVSDAGIVGMGGASFPTNVKLSVPPDKTVDTLIINGVECEPYLTCDYRLMIEKTEAIIEGVKIVQKVLNVKKTYIGIELNKKDAIKKIKSGLNGTDIKVVPCKVRYPQGGEKQLIKAVLGKEVPSGGLPFDVGVIVQNVGTILAIQEAVVYKKPLIERVVTVTGTIVKKPGNYKIRIGTTIQEIINDIELTEEPGKVLFGGPMMGITTASLEAPVIKGTSGVLFLSRKQAEKVRYGRYRDCIHCSRCLGVCPTGLQPATLSILAENQKYDEMKDNNMLDCIECGCCNYICPAFRPIVQMIKVGKLSLRKS